jgi:hypothetical protein
MYSMRRLPKTYVELCGSMAAWRNGIASDYDIGDQEIAGSTPAVVIFGACFQRNPTPTVIVGRLLV